MLIVIVVIDALAQRRSIEMTAESAFCQNGGSEGRREGMKDMLKRFLSTGKCFW